MDRIRELIAALDAKGLESPYLDRLRARAARCGKSATGLDALRAEIFAEMAASLGRAEDRVNEALLACDVLDREIASLSPGAERGSKIAEFNAQREIAERRLWELTVQREALGFRRNDDLARFYPIPARKSG